MSVYDDMIGIYNNSYILEVSRLPKRESVIPNNIKRMLKATEDVAEEFNEKAGHKIIKRVFKLFTGEHDSYYIVVDHEITKKYFDMNILNSLYIMILAKYNNITTE